jgi:hypothetical protein
MMEEEIEYLSGFLIVKNYPAIYREYVDKYKIVKDIYGIPRKDLLPSDQKIQYRGIDRDALNPNENSGFRSEIKMSELELQKKCDCGFLFDKSTVQEVYDLLEEQAVDYEIIWSRIAGSNGLIPEGFTSIGFEPSYFVGDHFSASCDCMIIPRWHGTDEEGTLFLEYFQKLNKYGLFNKPEETNNFLKYYLSFDWTETSGHYEIVEVFIHYRFTGN